jgi:hypothetical protein
MRRLPTGPTFNLLAGVTLARDLVATGCVAQTLNPHGDSSLIKKRACESRRCGSAMCHERMSSMPKPGKREGRPVSRPSVGKHLQIGASSGNGLLRGVK